MRLYISFWITALASAATEIQKYCFVRHNLFNELKGHPESINGCLVLFGDPTCAAGESLEWSDGLTRGGDIQEFVRHIF